jgi:hypothetical protein
MPYPPVARIKRLEARRSHAAKVRECPVGLGGTSSDSRNIFVELKRIAPLALAVALIATGSGCRGSSSAVNRRTTTHAGLPTPSSYAGTCSLVGSWCQPTRGKIPAALRRPLHLPSSSYHGVCPTSSGRDFSNGQFGGIALGSGPVRPLISASGGDKKHGVIAFDRRPPTSRWWQVKTLWFSYPHYRGPVFIRGRRLDRAGRIVFGEVPTLIDPQLPPKPTVNGTHGWREWPGATFIHSLGCWAWQIDGTSFSTVVVFKAVRRHG